MRSLIAPTEDAIKLAETKLTAGVSAGSNVALPVYGNTNFAANNYVCIGIPGSLTAEIQKINVAVSPGNSIQVATLLYSHSVDEPIQVFRYNQRKFYGALTQGGSYTELVSSGSPTNITVNDPQGTYFEYTGNEGYIYFKSTYFNSTTNEESDINDAIPMASDQSTRYCSLYDIRFQAGMQDNPYVTDDMFENYRLQAEGEINSYLYARYVLPLTNGTTMMLEVPALITNCAIKLAAGYSDYREYGKTGEGVKWLGEARGILNSIKKGTQRLIDANFVEFELKKQTQGVQSNANQTQGNPHSNRPIFTTRQQF
jgi:hypothetical protein